MTELFPAIDLLEGRCVRLRQGRIDDVTLYDRDPVARASSFAAAGARWVHVVDLDRAIGTGTDNADVVARIASALDGRAAVQTGGGLRDADAVAAMLDAGAARVVLGTAALEQPDLVQRLAAKYPGRIAAAVDARDGEVAVHGWTSGSGIRAVDLAVRLADAGVAALLATDVARDGMLGGPDVEGLSALMAATDVGILASGGVADADDCRTLAALRVGDRSLAGAVVGKAIYEGLLDVAEGVRILRGDDTAGPA